MPRPLPPALAESLPTSHEVALAGDVVRTLGGIGLPGDEVIGRMSNGQGTGGERVTNWSAAATALERAQRLLTTWGGIDAPEISSPELAHVDWNSLLTGYGAFEALGLQPEVIISPEGQDLDFWRQRFSQLRMWQDTNKPDAPHRLQRQTDGDGLWVHKDVAANWQTLAKTDQPRWSASVIPATAKAPFRSVDHNGHDSHSSMPQALNDTLAALPVGHQLLTHPSPESYLMLQATRLQAGEEPVDPYTDNLYQYSWLDGEFTSGTNQVAPCGSWRPGGGRVNLGWVRLDRRLDDLGVRPPVRG